MIWKATFFTFLLAAYDLPVFLDRFENSEDVQCALAVLDVRMLWDDCGAHTQCYEEVDPNDGLTYRWIELPSSGPVAEQPHLVTTADDFAGGWPVTTLEAIEDHYLNSQAVSAFVAARSGVWKPAGEEGNEIGQSSSGSYLPVIDEAWYLTMAWSEAPPPGTRLIVRNPENGRAVVASSGYETGPLENSYLAGVAEELHLYLGTEQGDTLNVGFALYQSVPLGPVDCP